MPGQIKIVVFLPEFFVLKILAILFTSDLSSQAKGHLAYNKMVFISDFTQ